MNIKLDGDEQLDRELEALRPEVEPPRDLWPHIAAGIHDSASRRERLRDWRTIGLAATVVLAANVLITLALIDRDDADTGYELAFHEPAVVAGSRGMVQPVDYGGGMRLGPSYLQDRQDLRRRMEAAVDSLDPELREALATDIDDLRAAQAEITDALMSDPDNTHLQRMLLRSLEDEVMLLSQVERLAAQQERRMDL